jgi:uncharacterized membrane protein
MDSILRISIYYVSSAAQILAIIVIAVGLLRATFLYLKEAIMAGDSRKAIALGRLELGLSFSLGLGFLIGSSILRSAIAPSWDDIGKLFATIAIRTIINYFLQLDVSKTNKELLEQDKLLETPFFRRLFGRIANRKSAHVDSPRDR